VKVIAVVLVILGPLLGTVFALVLVPSEPSDIVPAASGEPAQVGVTGTIRGIDASSGEMTVRLVLEPTELASEGEDPLVGPEGMLTEDVTIVVNDATGDDLRTIEAGQRLGALATTVELTGSRTTRYPLDRYRARVNVVLLRSGADVELVPTDLHLAASDSVFAVMAHPDAEPAGSSTIDLRVQRRWTVVGWAVFFVFLCWLLAISATAIGWTSIVRGIATPVWGWGFLIGVLFALPPLRTALAGNPPGGSLVDFAAFYWAVGIVSLNLVALVGAWNIRVRRYPHAPDAPAP